MTLIFNSAFTAPPHSSTQAQHETIQTQNVPRSQFPILAATPAVTYPKCPPQMQNAVESRTPPKRSPNPSNSPFRTPLTPQTTNSDASPRPHAPPIATSPLTIYQNASNASVPRYLPTPSKTPQHPLKPRRLPTKPPSDSTASTISTPASSQRRQLERQIIQARQDIDALRQALKIARSGQDDELERLADKWRGASRSAAEEVFAGVRDRVNRMGGVGAWRERENKRGGWGRWDEQEESNANLANLGGGFGCGDGEGESGEVEVDEEEVERERERAREEAEALYGEGNGERREEEKVVDEGKDDDTFTMDMMLKTLNIDLAVIGYDKERQMWVG